MHIPRGVKRRRLPGAPGAGKDDILAEREGGLEDGWRTRNTRKRRGKHEKGPRSRGSFFALFRVFRVPIRHSVLALRDRAKSRWAGRRSAGAGRAGALGSEDPSGAKRSCGTTRRSRARRGLGLEVVEPALSRFGDVPPSTHVLQTEPPLAGYGGVRVVNPFLPAR